MLRVRVLNRASAKSKNIYHTTVAIAGHGIDGVKIHLLYVVKGTKMESLYLSRKYRCLEQDEYAGLVCDFLELLHEELVIQRLTGDPHRDELAAPIWSLEKAKTIALIKNTLEKRDSRQGIFAP